jgi:hypothetical protein
MEDAVRLDRELTFPTALRLLEPDARVVLFALTELDYPTPILRRVAALATALDKELHILRVLALGTPSSRLPGSLGGPDVERASVAQRGTTAWCARTLLNPPIRGAIRVRVGDFAHEVSAHARDLSAACVVLAPSKTQWTPALTALTHRCRQPVFIAPLDSSPLATILALTAAHQRR